ncbi:MAG: hypothetical protein RLZZ519_1572 [Bacteroidota bacterium]
MPPSGDGGILNFGITLKRRYWILLGLITMMALGCVKRPDVFVAKGELSFSGDTVFFDTIFTSLPSPTERLVVRNYSGHNVLISKIKLQSGTDYSLIFDGIAAKEINDFELEDGDSVIAFISFTSDEKDEFTRDQLLFTIGANTQKVEIEGFVWDAVFYQDSVLGGFGSGNLTVMGPDKKHLIDGPLYVADGHTLRILPGTQIYFTPRKDDNFNLISSIIVFGRLLVEGQVGNEVVFQQTRFGERYEESGGQWRGIAFGNTAKASSIDHAIIKNGLIGIYQEYGNTGVGPKLTLTNTEIRSMGAYGILSFGYTDFMPAYPQILANNCLIHNCVEGTLGIYGGGKYEFNHSTFANYTVDFTRNKPQLVLNNYDSIIVYPIEARFENCLIWGSEEEEFAPDSFPVTNQFDVTFTASLVRTTLQPKGYNVITANDLDFPRFVDPTAGNAAERDYHLQRNSPAVNLGQPIPGLPLDKDHKPHDFRPDAGCYEFSE